MPPCARSTWRQVLLAGWWILAALPAAAAPANPLRLPAPAAIASPSPAPSPEAESMTDAVPRGAVRLFLQECRRTNWEAASKLLDLSALSPEERAEAPDLARRFKIVLDHTVWIDVDGLSDRPEGTRDDGLPPDKERLATILTAEGPTDLLLKRSPKADGALVWRIAPTTVRRIPALWDEFGYPPMVENLPRGLTERRFVDLAPWQWIGLLAVLVVAWALGFAVSWMLRRATLALARRTHADLDERMVRALQRPARLAVTLLLFFLGSFALRLTIPAQTWIQRGVKGLAVLLVAWMFLRAADLFAAALQERLISQNRQSATSAVTLGRRVAKALIVGLALLGALQNLGFNVTGILAGLGIGGLAVALASQKTIEHLFGGVVLTVDQPVRVGDSCRFGDKVGTIEDIGLRSTKVRTLDRTVVSVPNGELSSMQIENYNARDRFRLTAILNLRYDTTPDQLRWILNALRELLHAHPRIVYPGSPLRVRLVELGAYSLDVEVLAYVGTRDYDEFCAVREDVFLRILELVARSGTSFAFPSQTLYLGKDPGLDPARSGDAERQVARWRDEGTLPFPDVAPERAASLEGTLDWPPAGSASASGGPAKG